MGAQPLLPMAMPSARGGRPRLDNERVLSGIVFVLRTGIPWEDLPQELGPNPTDRGKLGSKRHLVTDRQGIPLMFCVTGANRHDSVVFEELIDAMPGAGGKRGRPRRWPDKLHADKGYDFARCRDHIKRRGIQDRIAQRH